MRRFAAALILLLNIGTPLQQPAAREIPFDSVTNFLKWPDNVSLGEAAGVALNSRGHLFVFSRGGHTQLFEFDKDGTLIKEIGHDLYGFDFAHVVRIDRNDNIWCVDEGSNMVIEFNPEGRVVLLLGRKWEVPEGRPEPPPAGTMPPPARTSYFNRPTDVTWDPAGNIFVSDGYNNSRVAKFDQNGAWVKAWGERGNARGQFNIPHTIASDAQGNIYVGDRTNRRIQVFDSNGTFQRQFAGVEQPWAICITPAPTQVLYSADANSGKIFKLDLNGNALGWLGTFGTQVKEFGWVHEIACPSENELYVGELLNWRVQRLTLHPDADPR